MEAIFTLPYSEYEVINQLQKELTKADGNSFYVPVSRQEKGVDFIIFNSKFNKCLKFQVKSSRSFNNKGKYHHGLWFHNFFDKIEREGADYYILFTLYQSFKNGKSDFKSVFWKPLMLCLNKKEMKILLKRINDSFLRIEFSSEKEIFIFKKDISLSDFSITKKINEIRDLLE